MCLSNSSMPMCHTHKSLSRQKKSFQHASQGLKNDGKCKPRAWNTQSLSLDRQGPLGPCHASTSKRSPAQVVISSGKLCFRLGGTKRRARSRVLLERFVALALSSVSHAASTRRIPHSTDRTLSHRFMLVPSRASVRFLGGIQLRPHCFPRGSFQNHHRDLGKNCLST